MNQREKGQHLARFGWIAGMSLLVAGTAQARDLAEPVAAVMTEDAGVRFVGRDIADREVMVARIAGPDGAMVERELISGSEAWLPAGKDGVYTYEIVAEPKVLINGSGPGPSDHNGRSLAVTSKYADRIANLAQSGSGVVQSGSYTVIDGRVVDASLSE